MLVPRFVLPLHQFLELMIMGEINVGAQFDDKYTTRDDKVALFYRFCYDDSIDFYFYAIYVEGSYCEIEVNSEGDIIRRNAKQEQCMCTYDGVGYVTSRREA